MYILKKLFCNTFHMFWNFFFFRNHVLKIQESFSKYFRKK